MKIYGTYILQLNQNIPRFYCYASARTYKCCNNFHANTKIPSETYVANLYHT